VPVKHFVETNKMVTKPISLPNPFTYRQRIERDIQAYSRTGQRWCCLEHPLEPFCAEHPWH